MAILRLQLKYVDGKVPVVSGLKRISKPGLRVYARKTDIPRVLGGLGHRHRQHQPGDHDRRAGPPGPARRRSPRLRLVGEGTMSRIGRLPITVPAGVEVTLDGRAITVKGPKGTLARELHPDMRVVQEDGSSSSSARPTRRCTASSTA